LKISKKITARILSMFDEDKDNAQTESKINEVIYAIDGCLDECILIDSDESKMLSQTLELARFQKVLLHESFDKSILRRTAWRRKISGIDSVCVQTVEIFSSSPDRNWMSGFTLVKTSVTFGANND
jgi:hypothetical protein